MTQSASWFGKTSKMKAEASKFLDVIDQTGFTDEACQIIYQHLSKLFIVILHTHTHTHTQKKKKKKHFKPELFES